MTVPLLWRRLSMIVLPAMLCCGPATAKADVVANPTVGIEGSLTVEIPGPRLFAIPQDKTALLSLWIADVEDHGDSHRYEFRFIGMKAGKHRLLYYLRYEDGSRPVNVDPVFVDIGSALPVGHSGYLTAIKPVPIELFRWYREILLGALLLWIGLLFPLVFAGRKKQVEEAAPIAPPSLADRLRPLVVKAADGTLTVPEKALFERLMLGYWCGKLNLDPGETLGSMAVLREHEVAGELIHLIETWLHKPGGAREVDVAALLEPYRNVHTDEEVVA